MVNTTLDPLERSWLRAWSGAGVSRPGAAVFHALLAAYGEPHRKYHTLQHLRECLTRFDDAAVDALRAAEVEIALWFHDAVYDVNRSDNEVRSADWARGALLEAGASHDGAERVHALIMVTTHSGVPASADERLLVDIDLAIFGSDSARFAEYEQQIRAEYGHVPEALFKEKRRSILRSFIDRERIYGTPRLYADLERPARANLARAVAATLA